MITSVSLNHYVSTNRLDFLSRLSRGWVCVCVCVCVCVWFLQEACQLEDSSVVSNWGGDAVSSPPTLMSWGGGRHAGGFCGGQFVHFVRFGVDSHSLSVFILVIILHMQF